MTKRKRRTHRSAAETHHGEPARGRDFLSQMGRMLGDSFGYVRDTSVNVAAGTARAAGEAIEVTRRVGMGVGHATEAAVTATMRGAGEIGGAAADTIRSMALAAAAGMEAFAVRTRTHQPEPPHPAAAATSPARNRRRRRSHGRKA